MNNLSHDKVIFLLETLLTLLQRRNVQQNSRTGNISCGYNLPSRRSVSKHY